MRLSPIQSIDQLARSLQIVSALVTALGVAVIIGPGFLNPLRFGKYFVALGVICFFVPGVAGVVAGSFLRQRVRWAWLTGLCGAAFQTLVAAVLFGGQFFLSPLSPVPLIGCAAWALAGAYLLVQLVRLRGTLASDPIARGFEVSASQPR